MTILCLRTSSLWLILKELAPTATLLKNFTKVCVMVLTAVVAAHTIVLVYANRDHAPFLDTAILKATGMISTMFAIQKLNTATITMTIAAPLTWSGFGGSLPS